VLLCYCVTVLLCHCVTVSLCHCVTVLLCHCVTVLLCHCNIHLLMCVQLYVSVDYMYELLTWTPPRQQDSEAHIPSSVCVSG
jgi:hypothetical protein